MVHSTGAYIPINSAEYCSATRSFFLPLPLPSPDWDGYLPGHSSNLDYSHTQSTALKFVDDLQSLLTQN